MTKIIMVCLGNICRSPLAEGILRSKAEKSGLNISIDSAGTSNYHIGNHPDIRTIINAKKHNVDISYLRARQFTKEDYDTFDQIFVMDKSNYADIIALARSEKDKQKVELILERVYPGSGMSVPDPYFGGDQGFENVYILLDKACDVIIDSLLNK